MLDTLHRPSKKYRTLYISLQLTEIKPKPEREQRNTGRTKTYLASKYKCNTSKTVYKFCIQRTAKARRAY